MANQAGSAAITSFIMSNNIDVTAPRLRNLIAHAHVQSRGEGPGNFSKDWPKHVNEIIFQ